MRRLLMTTAIGLALAAAAPAGATNVRDDVDIDDVLGTSFTNVGRVFINNNGRCVGTLLDHRTVMTSGDCVVPGNGGRQGIVIDEAGEGRVGFNQDGSDFGIAASDVSGVFVMPRWLNGARAGRNISLLYTRDPIRYDPVELPTPESDGGIAPTLASNLIFVGYGDGSGSAPNVDATTLRRAVQNVLDHNQAAGELTDVFGSPLTADTSEIVVLAADFEDPDDPGSSVIGDNRVADQEGMPGPDERGAAVFLSEPGTGNLIYIGALGDLIDADGNPADGGYGSVGVFAPVFENQTTITSRLGIREVVVRQGDGDWSDADHWRPGNDTDPDRVTLAPDNSRAAFALDSENLRYYYVRMPSGGTTTVTDLRQVDLLDVTNEDAVLDIRGEGNLQVLVRTRINTGTIRVRDDGRLTIGELEMAERPVTPGAEDFVGDGDPEGENDPIVAGAALVQVDSGGYLSMPFGARIADGTLQVNGAVNSDTILVGGVNTAVSTETFELLTRGGVLAGTGTITTTDRVRNIQGIVNPGASVGTLTIDGDFQNGQNAFFLVEIGAAGADRLNVTGDAVIDGTVQVIVIPENDPISFEDGEYVIVDAGSLSGTFDEPVDSPTRDYEVRTEGNQVIMTFERLGFAAVADTRNQTAAAQALESAIPGAEDDMRDVLNRFDSVLDPDELQALYDQVGGQTHTSRGIAMVDAAGLMHGLALTRTVAVRTGRANLQQSLAHVGTPRHETGIQLAALPGDSDLPPAWTSVATGADQEPGTQTAQVANPQFEARRWGVWVQGFGSSTERDSQELGGQYDTTTTGIAGGIDIKVDDTALIGLLVGYGATDFNFENLDDNAEANIFTIGAYGSAEFDGWALAGAATFGFGDYKTDRVISATGIDRNATSDHNGSQFAIGGEVARVVRHRGWRVEPLVGAQFTMVEEDSFTETGAGSLNLNVQAEETTSARGAVGLRVARESEQNYGVTFTPELSLRYTREFLDTEASASMAFEGSNGSGFTVVTDEISPDVFSAGIGFTMASSGGVAVEAGYRYDISGEISSHNGIARLRLAF